MPEKNQEHINIRLYVISFDHINTRDSIFQHNWKRGYYQITRSRIDLYERFCHAAWKLHLLVKYFLWHFLSNSFCNHEDFKRIGSSGKRSNFV